MKIFLVAFIYRYALISVIGDKDIGDNSESLVTKFKNPRHYNSVLLSHILKVDQV